MLRTVSLILLLIWIVCFALLFTGCTTRPAGPDASLFPDTVPRVLSTDPPAFGPQAPGEQDFGMMDPPGDRLLDRALRVIQIKGGLAAGELWASATIGGFGPRAALTLLTPLGL